MDILKSPNNEVTFSEIPDEITLCINISNCPNRCKNCHSEYLWKNIGEPLYIETLYDLIDKNQGITCVCFMGGDSNPTYINILAKAIKYKYNLKVGWYSGKSKLSKEIDLRWFNFIKLGPYMEQFGPLNNPNTNQKFFKVEIINNKPTMVCYTNLFWK